MKKIALSVIALFAFLSISIAQNQFGLRAGLTIASTTNYQEADELENLWPAGLVAGLATSFRAGDNFAIAPEINYVQKGNNVEGRYSSNITDFDGYTKSSLNYLEVPILFRIHFGDVLGGYLNAGPTFGYLLSGKYTVDNNVVFYEDDFDVEDAGFNRMEVGGAIGGGLALNTEIGTFLVDLRYTRGFTKLYKDEINVLSNPVSVLYDTENARNQTISTSLIFLIPSNR